jgi:hypothetical protein
VVRRGGVIHDAMPRDGRRGAASRRHPWCNAVGAKQTRSTILVMTQSVFAFASPLPHSHATHTHRPPTTTSRRHIPTPPTRIGRPPRRRDATFPRHPHASAARHDVATPHSHATHTHRPPTTIVHHVATPPTRIGRPPRSYTTFPCHPHASAARHDVATPHSHAIHTHRPPTTIAHHDRTPPPPAGSPPRVGRPEAWQAALPSSRHRIAPAKNGTSVWQQQSVSKPSLIA